MPPRLRRKAADRAWRAHLATIRPDAGLAEADWWETSWPNGVLTPPAVGFLIPRGFEAYARVLHPAHDSDRDSVRWASVAQECGTALHPQAQWWQLARRADPSDQNLGWQDSNPLTGCLERGDLTALADVLARHTSAAERTYVAFWVGSGLWPSAWDGIATTDRPVRASYLFERPLAQVPTLCSEAPAVAYAMGTPPGTGVWFLSDGTTRQPTADEQFETWAHLQWQSPSAWWPADRAWATSTDTDLDSTLVGGSRALVDDLLADGRLEVLPWPVDGSLWADADTVNR